jgi:ribosome maturation factor RimP
VTSPGVERNLRLPAHFQREIGKTVNVRLADVGAEQRRIEGVLVAADHESATLQVEDPATGGPVERVVAYTDIDKARTVFVWGPTPKPGKQPSGAKKSPTNTSNKEKRAS